MKNRMIIAEHNASGQKMIMIEPSKEDLLTKEDIKSDDIQEKINSALAQNKIKLIKFENIKISKKGEFTALEQRVPYVKINAEISLVIGHEVGRRGIVCDVIFKSILTVGEGQKQLGVNAVDSMDPLAFRAPVSL